MKELSSNLVELQNDMAQKLQDYLKKNVRKLQKNIQMFTNIGLTRFHLLIS